MVLLQKIFEEGEIHGVSSKLKEMTDERQNMEQFQKDQARNGKQILRILCTIEKCCPLLFVA